MHSKTCIVVAGPTAVGKTSLAIQLAAHFNTEIISADSRQCYRELNIGVAKPTNEQLSAVRHHFINSHSIFEDVNAAAFETYALHAAAHIFKSNDFAVMVGGTGLYIKAFCEGMDPIPPVPTEIRNSIIANYEQLGLSWLQEAVREADPTYYETAEVLNPQRLMRALEVFRTTGASITQFHSSPQKQRPFNIIKIGLELPREQLYEQINGRVEEMIQAGLLAEVEKLLPYEHQNALQTVGYKELFEYLKGIVNLAAAVNAIKLHTRHYAKRQMTWFKKDTHIKWFHPSDTATILAFLEASKSTT